jgi:hypothetical protein
METRKISDLTNFEQRVLHQSFKQKFGDSGKVTDFVLSENPDIPEIKNVCAKLHVNLVSRLDNVINNLDMSKREFIEIALIEALDKAEAIFNDVEPFSAHYVEEAK